MHFDGTITLGSIITAAAFIVMSLFAWRDLDWRIKNIESWQKKHIVDEGVRDLIIDKMDKVLQELRWQTGHMLGKKTAPPLED